MIKRGIGEILACPKCKGALVDKEALLVCEACSLSFKVIGGVPIFFEVTGMTAESSDSSVEKKSAIKRAFKNIFPKVSLTTLIDDSYINSALDAGKEGVVLNLGSGLGRFDKKLEDLEMINLDIGIAPGVDVVADGHELPFKDSSFDCVFSNAVFEHMSRPWEAAIEVGRVLKPGGLVCINLPFLAVIHEDYDFYRFTEQGLRELFKDFECVKSGVSGGPASFLTYFMAEYISMFFPTRALSAVVRDMVSLLVY